MDYREAMLLLSQCGLGVLVVDENEKVLEANEAAEQFLHVQDQLKGSLLTDIAPAFCKEHNGQVYVNTEFGKYLKQCPSPETEHLPENARMVVFREATNDACHDVLIHAIMDALLGAAALGDIGKHFPDTDPAYKGISSVKLLVHVAGLLKENDYVIGNIDATIIAQKPKMAPHIPTMRENIAEALGIKISQLNIKATTEEGLGFTGEGLGISSQAIALLEN
mgnify:CR=1 FL=1